MTNNFLCPITMEDNKASLQTLPPYPLNVRTHTQIWLTDSAKIKTAAFQIDGQISYHRSANLISALVRFLPRQHFHRFAADQNGAQYYLKNGVHLLKTLKIFNI